MAVSAPSTDAALTPHPVLIVGAAPRVALAASRSLHAHGVEAYLASATAGEGPLRSRSVAGFFRLPDAQAEPAGFDDGLIAAMRATGADLLMACSDAALAGIARGYDALRPIADPGSPPAAIAGKVLDKKATLETAAALGIAAPTTYRFHAGEMDLASMSFPVIAKARGQTIAGGVRIRRFDDAASLSRAIADDDEFDDRYVVQQWIPGQGEGVAVLMSGGRPMATFQHRRIKEFPSSGGVSVVSESVAPDSALVEPAVALLRAIGWEGVAQVEFRREAGGPAMLMEINGRYWGTLSTAIAAGVDFPYLQWRAAHGLAVEKQSAYRTGVRVRWTRGAILRLRERAFDGARGADGRGWRAEWRSFREDFGPSTGSAMWRGDDPMPAVADAMPAASRLFASLAAAMVKRALPRDVARARSRFGTAGAVRFAWRSLLRSAGIEREAIPAGFRPRKVLFVCAGNIMRSVLAAASFAAELRRRGIAGVDVRSAGLVAARGEPADPRTVEAATKAGLDVASHRATPIDDVDLPSFDAIFVMEHLQQADLERRCPEVASKTFALGACLPGLARIEIDDPNDVPPDRCTQILEIVRDRATVLADAIATS